MLFDSSGPKPPRLSKILEGLHPVLKIIDDCRPLGSEVPLVQYRHAFEDMVGFPRGERTLPALIQLARGVEGSGLLGH